MNKRSKKDIFWNFLEGGFLERLFNRHTIRWIVAVALFFVLLTANNFYGLLKIRTISRQRKELKELQMEYVTISTKLMSEKRLSSVEDRVKEEELGIEIPKTSPIEIEK